MATLTATEILMDTMDAFRVVVRPLDLFTKALLSGQPAGYRLGQQAIAHIRKQPTASDYSAATGYANGATQANTLFDDVPLTINKHRHVPISISYLNSIRDKKQEYQALINDAAVVLGKEIVDDVLADVTAANLSKTLTYSEANSDSDMLEDAQTAMNVNGASMMGRYGIVNSGVAKALSRDPAVSSADFHGQLNGVRAYREFEGMNGFERIVEYPDLPANGENLTGIFGDSRMAVVGMAMPEHSQNLAQELGIPTQGRFFPISDPDSNLQLLGIMWQQPGTFDMWLTVTAMWGKSVGRAGGAVDAQTDRAGVRLVSA